MKKTENNEDEFFNAIEKKFNQLRGTPIIISPQEWALMAQWKKRGIPAIVILEALERGFDRTAAGTHRKRAINSLSYFRQIVEDCWDSFQSLKVGKSEHSKSESEEEKVSSHLESLMKRMNSLSEKHRDSGEISTLLKECSSDIEELLSRDEQGEDDIALIEEKLGEIDERIARALLENADPAELQKAAKEADEELSHMSDFVDRKRLIEMKNKFIAKKLRKKYGIPRISLFFS